MYASESSVRESFLRAKQDIEGLRQENRELRAMVFGLMEKLQEQKPVVDEPQPIAGGDLKSALKEALAEMGARAPEADSIGKFGLDKKAVIKAKILETVGHAPVMLPRLKEIMVDQNDYCSKASFYRYFDELKREEKVSLIEMNGRTIVRSNRVEVYNSD